MTRPYRLALSLVLAAPLMMAARPLRIPADAPYCALPSAQQLFVSPAGEPFRAPAGQPYPSAAWATKADTNANGSISRAELAADARRFFASLDTDHDARLSPEEVERYEREVAPEIALYSARREPGAAGDGGYAGPMGAGRFAWLNIPQPVASADMDFDRMVSADEFAAAASRRFDALSAGRPGELLVSALPRTPAQIAVEGPCRPRPKKPDRPDDRNGQASPRRR